MFRRSLVYKSCKSNIILFYLLAAKCNLSRMSYSNPYILCLRARFSSIFKSAIHIALSLVLLNKLPVYIIHSYRFLGLYTHSHSIGTSCSYFRRVIENRYASPPRYITARINIIYLYSTHRRRALFLYSPRSVILRLARSLSSASSSSSSFVRSLKKCRQGPSHGAFNRKIRARTRKGSSFVRIRGFCRMVCVGSRRRELPTPA